MAVKGKPHLLERRTPIVLRPIAERVWEAAVALVGEPLPRAWIACLCRRAKTVFAHNHRFQKLIEQPGDAGHDWLWAFMRHGTAALIYRHRRQLYSHLPPSFARGVIA